MKSYIGIDISKAHLDVAVVDDQGKSLIDDLQVKNTEKGIKELLTKLDKSGASLNESWFCFEHTGSYGLLLCHLLQELQLTYSVVPALEIKRSMGMQRGKNDKVDALRIARYASRFANKLKAHRLPSQALQQLKDLFTYRQQLVTMCSQFKNSLKHYQLTCSFTQTDTICLDIEQQLEALARRIKAVEEQIKNVLKLEKQMEQNVELAQSVKGIGLMTAVYMLVTTNNFQSFQSARQFNCYAGIAPFEHSSGSSIRGRTKVSHLGNKKMKTLLYNAANSAAQFDPELKQYCERKKSEGKHHQLVINAIACKLVARVFAVIKRQTPYIATYANNFNKKVA